MQSYSPYQAQKSRKSFQLPQLPRGWKTWLKIISGIIITILIIGYISLGELRLFANNYLRLTFFSKNYLIVLQNNYELRPGGGFITAYGNLDTLFGFTRNLSFHNSYDIDTTEYIDPPYPHEDLLKNEWYQGYTFRDANWEPHFPKTADELIKFYQQKFPKKDVDGIIVVNFRTIEELVGKLESIKLNNELLNKDNLFSKMEFAVNNVDRHSKEALAKRKDILKELATALTKKVKWHPFKAKAVVINALHNKNIYFWFKSKGMQKKIVKRGWGNTFELPQNSDFLAVNLANLGSKKADRYMQTEVRHHVNITENLPEITTDINIHYPGSLNSHSDNYKGYLRLYLPGQAAIQKNPIDSRITTEDDLKVVGATIILPAGSSTHLSYTYSLPRTYFMQNDYNLRLIKQSGSEMMYWITIESAPDTMITTNDFMIRENRATFVGQLKNDRDFKLKILPDLTPPYPIEQVFDKLNQISIFWSEPISPATATDTQNYTVTDLNMANQTTDEITVSTAEITGPNTIRLTLEGVTKQPLEHYQIQLKDIRDQAGNNTVMNPKNITVVQRFN